MVILRLAQSNRHVRLSAQKARQEENEATLQKIQRQLQPASDQQMITSNT